MSPAMPRVDMWPRHDGPLSFRSEADLRDGLAAIAYFAGWSYEVEHILPQWGRIDLLLIQPQRWVIEIKTDLTRPRQVRSALMQASGYLTRLPFEAHAIVTAPDDYVDTRLCNDFASQVAGVDVIPLEDLFAFLRAFGDATVARDRRANISHLRRLASVFCPFKAPIDRDGVGPERREVAT